MYNNNNFFDQFFNFIFVNLKLPGTTGSSSGSSVVGILVGCIFGVVSFILIIGPGYFCFRRLRLKESNC